MVIHLVAKLVFCLSILVSMRAQGRHVALWQTNILSTALPVAFYRLVNCVCVFLHECMHLSAEHRQAQVLMYDF